MYVKGEIDIEIIKSMSIIMYSCNCKCKTKPVTVLSNG